MYLKVGQTTEVNFGERDSEIENTQYLVRIKSGARQWVFSVEGGVEVATRHVFPEMPYFFRFPEPLISAPRSLLKIFIKVPLVEELAIESNREKFVVHRHMRGYKKIWYGEAHSGVMCIYVEPEILLEPERGDFANLPIRLSTKSKDSLSIEGFILYPEYLILYHGENGLYTNRVSVDIIGENEVKVTYGRGTTRKAGKHELLVDQLEKPPKNIITAFAPMELARYFGL